MLSITLDWREVQTKITALSGALSSRDILDQSAALLLHNILQRFLQQVDADGTPWPAIKPATQKAKMRKYNGGGILFASGKLWHSIQLYAGPDENSRAIGTDVPYGVFHQYGTIHMPKREFLAFSQRDVEMVQSILETRVKEAMSHV